MESIQCLECAHYLGAHSCSAFPDRIPDAIMTGEHDHREPFPGDNGIRFSPIEGAPKETDEDAE